MKNIRRVYGLEKQVNAKTLVECKRILLSQFPYLSEREADEIFSGPGKVLGKNFDNIVLIAEGRNKHILGLVVASHFYKEKIVFLDYIATRVRRISGGIGGALYERLRDEAGSLSAVGIFFECLPDAKELCYGEENRKQNIARLRFYEKYGARPIVNINYELPRQDNSVFHLVFDGLGARKQLDAEAGRGIVAAILKSKAAKKCSRKYIDDVVGAIKGNLTLRAPIGRMPKEVAAIDRSVPLDKKIPLIVNDGHLIHHIKEKGYLESPVRVNSIRKELDKTQIFETVPAKAYPDRHVQGVHDRNYLKFLKEICEAIGNKETRYGDVFPVRNQARLPKDIELQIGYYCIDASTPLNANAYIAARGAVDCALTAAELVLKGRQMAYALVRPPGHHAESKYFGGFCYLNSNAVATHYLSERGPVAILDVDYHHGNGQQEIFYSRSDVFTVSIHGNPEYAYPNFAGFVDETGEGDGEGFNMNIVLPQGTTGERYQRALKRALDAIRQFKPEYLVVALGLDVAKGDPSGTWLLSADDFHANGQMVSALRIPTVVVQEGGYQNKVLGKNARRFFQGMWDGYYLK